MENHNFNEKTTERYKGKDLKVWQSPKYAESKKKAIEMIDSNKYGLTDGDFWVLMNTYDNESKMMYTGLIITHNGCLKINEALENYFQAKYLTRTWIGDTLIYEYNDGTLYEVGEVSPKNCKNEYPYAMAYKRCFDRVVLKKCKLAFSGIYSENEADEFKQPQEEEKPSKTKKPSGMFDEPTLPDLAKEFVKLYGDDEAMRILKGLKLTRFEDIGTKNLQKYINYKKYGEKQIDKGKGN